MDVWLRPILFVCLKIPFFAFVYIEFTIFWNTILVCMTSDSFSIFWPRDYKIFFISTQLSMNFVLQINLKLLTIAISFLKNIAEHENFSANKYENANYYWHFHIY